MKKNLLLAAALISVVSMACNNPTTDESATTEQPTENTEAIAMPGEPMSGESAPDGSMPMEMNVSPAPNAGSAAPASGARLNPAHGEPGHDCAIAVGQPLPDNNKPGGVQVQTPPPANIQMQPSTPGSAAPTSVMSAPPIGAPVQSAPVAGKTAPGMNPPHGEPGHDCAVPVGSPLKK